MQQAHWFDRVVTVVEEALRDEPDEFWEAITKGGGKSGECWRYGPLPMPILVLGLGKTPAEVAFFLTHDRWPEGLRHWCNDQLCANPDHLVESSREEQSARWRHRRRRLTDEQVKEIRHLHREKRWPYHRLADRYDADESNVEDAYWGRGRYEEAG